MENQKINTFLSNFFPKNRLILKTDVIYFIVSKKDFLLSKMLSVYSINFFVNNEEFIVSFFWSIMKFFDLFMVSIFIWIMKNSNFLFSKIRPKMCCILGQKINRPLFVTFFFLNFERLKLLKMKFIAFDIIGLWKNIFFVQKRGRPRFPKGLASKKTLKIRSKTVLVPMSFKTCPREF